MINIHKITLKFKCVPWNESVHYIVYVQINQPIMIYLKKKSNFNNIFSIYMKQYYNCVI